MASRSTAPHTAPPSPPAHEGRRKGLLWPTIAMLGALAVLLGLGTWQLQRKFWKDGVLARIAAERTAPPVEGTATWPAVACRVAETCEYTPVRLRGRFDHTAERHIFTAPPQAKGVAGASRAGFWVFTPLRLDGGGTAYVNRGFIPEELKAISARGTGATDGAVEIVGHYRTAQVRGTFDGANDTGRNIWYVRAPAELWSAESGIGANARGVYLDMIGPIPDGGWPRPLAGRIEISNRHLEYALTWFGLAGTLLAVYGAFAYGRLRAR